MAKEPKVDFMQAPTLGPGNGILKVDATYYIMVRLRTDLAGTGFRLAKVGHEGPGRTKKLAIREVYNVLLGTISSCDCRGFESHDRCKHLFALSKLAREEKI
jgi:hypothetical protein